MGTHTGPCAPCRPGCRRIRLNNCCTTQLLTNDLVTSALCMLATPRHDLACGGGAPPVSRLPPALQCACLCMQRKEVLCRARRAACCPVYHSCLCLAAMLLYRASAAAGVAGLPPRGYGPLPLLWSCRPPRWQLCLPRYRTPHIISYLPMHRYIQQSMFVVLGAMQKFAVRAGLVACAQPAPSLVVAVCLTLPNNIRSARRSSHHQSSPTDGNAFQKCVRWLC